MNLAFRRKITSFLDVRELIPDGKIFADISAKEWTRELRWLDRSGLALPLMDNMQRRALTHSVPPVIAESLQRGMQDNQKRMSAMLAAFAQITRSFDAQGISYACVKGFSLVPDYLPSTACRHQTDFDFLVSDQNVEQAEQILLGLGYRLLEKEASGERRFATPGAKMLGKDAYLYALQESYAVELHLHFWEEEEEGVQIAAPTGWLEQLETHAVEGVVFPRLRPAYQLTYQLLHFFRHLYGIWGRLFWLYEIARFVSAHLSEEDLWQEVCLLWRADEKLKQVCHFMLRLAERVFAAPIPAAVQAEADDWEVCRLWINHFSDESLYVDLPGNKVSLLFIRPFFENTEKYRRYQVGRLLPIGPGKGHVVDERVSLAVARSLHYRLKNISYQASRLVYHVRANLHFLLLKIQWEGLRVLEKFRQRPVNDMPLKETLRREAQ